MDNPSSKHRRLIAVPVSGAGLREARSATSSSELDLRDQSAMRAFFEAHRPQVVVLAAAKVGGILANNTYPADLLGDNLRIQVTVLEAAHAVGVERPHAVEISLSEAVRGVEVPPDLGAALGADPEVQAAFDALSYTHRKEFVRCVSEAKKDATRAERVAGTVEMVRTGRTR